MKYVPKSILLVLAPLLLTWHASALVAASDAPELELPESLAIAQIKMTGDEFVILHNNSGEGIPTLAQYRLESFNNAQPLANDVSSSAQQLPGIPLAAGSSIVLSAAPRATCGAAAAGKLGISLTDGSGYMQLVRMQQGTDGSIEQESVDALSWSSAAVGHIQNVPSSTKNPQALYYRYAADDEFKWQLAEASNDTPCQINVVVQGAAGQQKVTASTDLLSSEYQEAPATVISVAGADTAAPLATVPAANKGLMAPQITEILPNPKGTGTDATDEFIELYNPNPAPFDLSGYKLQTGTSSVRSYVIPTGTILPPKSFVTFTSEVTGLTLSNTAGQLRLSDPTGAVIGSSEPYKNAKDGVAWALAKGKWHYTSSLTPGKPNVITNPSVRKTTVPKSKTKNSSNVVKSAGTYSAQPTSTQPNDGGLSVKPIQGAVVALVALAAVLYGSYEYRHDLANVLQQLRGKLGLRR